MNRLRIASPSLGRGLAASTLLAIALATTGCGNGLAKLEGEVSVDGQPLRATGDVRGAVMFQPVTAGPSSAGTIDEDGHYVAYTGAQEGLPPGEYLVTLRAVKVIPPKDEYSMPGARRITPSRYANAQESGLTVTVDPGSNEWDIDIASK